MPFSKPFIQYVNMHIFNQLQLHTCNSTHQPSPNLAHLSNLQTHVNFFWKFTVHILTVDHYCSQLTVDRYCSSQYNNCIAIQFSAPQAFSCNTIFPLHTFILQYNFSTAYLYCNTIFSPLHHHIAIQCNTLQYNSSAYLQASLQYNPLYCNTIFQTLSPPKLQYNTSIAI